MDKADVLIVGAGASGLAAAYELCLAGRKVLVLEGRDRIGGRINSLHLPGFDNVVEEGAEFIHGHLPLTTSLLKKAGIKHHVSGGKMYRIYKGKVQKTSQFIDGWDEVMEELNALQQDMPIGDFMNQNFGGAEYEELRQSMLGFVEGYDAADASKASSFSLRDEWENDEEDQGRVNKGYTELITFFAEESKKRGAEIKLLHTVKSIRWKQDEVEALTSDGQSFVAAKAIITLPLGVWQATQSNASVSFVPELSQKFDAAQKMGFGGVIKFNLQFISPFWETDVPHKMKNAGFILSDAEIPTWWTQNPNHNGILSGWIAGPKAAELKDFSKEVLLQKAIQSLAFIFSVDEEFIKNRLKGQVISNWMADPYTLGAYSYATLQTAEAKKVMSEPVGNTLFFAGEALYDGPETGTVEGALVNGTEVARRIISGEPG